MPHLILHADDFGMSRAVNAGIFYGFRFGLLTSTALLANGPDAAWALQRWPTLLQEHAAGRTPWQDARRRLGDPELPFDLGVHLNLTQGRPLTGERYPAALLTEAGLFPSVSDLMRRLRRNGPRFRQAIHDELARQIAVLLDHGLRPTHLNGHQYIEMMPTIREIVLELLSQFSMRVVRVAREPGLWRTTLLHRGNAARWPLAQVKRWFAGRFLRLIKAKSASQLIQHPDAYFGTAHAGQIDLALLKLFLGRAKNGQSVEVGLHPSEATNNASVADGWSDPLYAQRPGELAMLTSAELGPWLADNGWQLGRLAALPD